MGTFHGHVMVGSFLIVFALWWIFSAFFRYYRSLRRGSRYTSTVTFPCLCLSGRFNNWPFEAGFKLIVVSVAFVLDLYNSFEHGEFVEMKNAQHCTIYAFFGLSAVTDLLTHFKAPLPPNTDYIFTLVALLVEGLLFGYHLHLRSELDVRVHTLFIFSIMCSIFAVMAEMRYRHNILSTLARAYFILLQGTWLWQVGFILFSPTRGDAPWVADHDKAMVMVTLVFTWHGFLDLLFILIIGLVFNRCSCNWNKGNFQADVYLLHERRNSAAAEVSLNMHTGSKMESGKYSVTKTSGF